MVIGRTLAMAFALAVGTSSANAQLLLCRTQTESLLDRELLHQLRSIPALFTSTELSNAKQPVFILRGNKKIKYAAAEKLEIGDRIQTLPDQTVRITQLIPSPSSLMVLPNSDIEILKLPSIECGISIRLNEGEIQSEGEHKNMGSCQDWAEVETPEVEVIPVGTKYKVSVGKKEKDKMTKVSKEKLQKKSKTIRQTKTTALHVRRQTFDVTQGKIQLRLRRVPGSKISTTQTFHVQSGQRARIRVNEKTRLAEIEYFTPD